ncbi:hypothetical protein DFP72DRAFT_1067940 [Ephemerocybe angulata]|uniref:CxC2-like cysteine cluster KDZ transposase-associated domain-containing protein n=1 Tax=Ephemerocybe angulata TaxID=980116 RepID=A0A8H6HZP1_9AGAR|nr:hypothetical protein DFP72DRAFT_1067940 [Tulosesus angulatus]
MPPSPVKKSSASAHVSHSHHDIDTMMFSMPEPASNSNLSDHGNETQPMEDPPAEEASEESEWETDSDDDEIALPTEGKKRKRRTRGDRPFLYFIPKIGVFVEEMLRLEGLDCLTGSQLMCSSPECRCALESGSGYRCVDCSSTVLYCKSCTVQNHGRVPLHRLQRWTGTHFERAMLKELGLQIQLGHPLGTRCHVPEPADNNTFTIIDSDGIHVVNLNFCGCLGAVTRVQQLLRHRLFPSTTIHPRSAATFCVLETFQMLSFTSRVSGYEFMRALERRTDNTGCLKIPKCYASWMRMVREYRHIRLLKRRGRGHDPAGIQNTAPGECAVLCPACPYPDLNLPPDWEMQPDSKQWLYSLFIGMDANFRLRRKNVSSEEFDPSLNAGSAYIVEETKFKGYLQEYDKKLPDEKSDCNNHDAIKSASIRGGKGSAASGMGSAQCSRHDMKRPLGVGDLQKGERYVNMDYFLLSTLNFHPPRRLVLSYDICCQYHKNLRTRCTCYPPNAFTKDPPMKTTYAIPKFHLPAHIEACQTRFSLNWLPRVGRTDFGDHNSNKITNMAKTFKDRSTEAINKRLELVSAFLTFTKALPSSSLEEWTAAPKGSNVLNPFENSGVTALKETSVRLQLAEEDKQVIARGDEDVVHVDVSPSMMIWQGIEIEEQQRKLKIDTEELGMHSTDLQRAKVLERGNSILRKIEAWVSIQHLYIPRLATLRKTDEETAELAAPPAAYDIPLYLPSSVTHLKGVHKRFMRFEDRYRKAQASSTLQDLRSALLLKAYMKRSKRLYSHGQKQQTRSNALLKSIEARIGEIADKYRYIRQCLERLSMPLKTADWQVSFQPLNPDDIQMLTRDEEDNKSEKEKRSEGHRKLTWIWMVQGVMPDDEKSEVVQTALHSEWCKSRARAHRWQEECLLLAEEMRRVRLFFQWEIKQWEDRASRVAHGDFIPKELTNVLPQLMYEVRRQDVIYIDAGRSAYAARQIAIRERMLGHMTAEWKGLEYSLENVDTAMEGFVADVFVEYE